MSCDFLDDSVFNPPMGKSCQQQKQLFNVKGKSLPACTVAVNQFWCSTWEGPGRRSKEISFPGARGLYLELLTGLGLKNRVLPDGSLPVTLFPDIVCSSPVLAHPARPWRVRLRKKMRAACLEPAPAALDQDPGPMAMTRVVCHSFGAGLPVVYTWPDCLALAAVSHGAWDFLGEDVQILVRRQRAVERDCLRELPWCTHVLDGFSWALHLVAEALQWWKNVSETCDRPPLVKHMALLMLSLGATTMDVTHPDDEEKLLLLISNRVPEPERASFEDQVQWCLTEVPQPVAPERLRIRLPVATA